MAQHADPAVDTYQVVRGLTFSNFGAIYTGAGQHHIFGWLQTHCTGSWLLPAAVECTLVNQCVIIPLLYYPLFFLLSGLSRGMGLQSTFMDARRNYVPFILSNWRFWLPVQAVLFACVSAEFLVLATCLAGVVWNFILSSLTYRKRASSIALA